MLRIRTIALIVGVVGALLGGLGWWTAPHQFFPSYLFAFLYWWELSMGLLGLALLYQMVGGQWGYAARPFFDSGVRMLPAVSLGFLPVAFGLRYIYVWAEPGFFADIPHSGNRQWYLHPPFFLGRSASFLIISTLVGWVVTWRVIQPDGLMTRKKYPRFGGLSAVAVALIVTFAAFDWIMSLEPEWYSTLYGFIVGAGGMLSGLCVAAAGVALSVKALGIPGSQAETALHDLGKLMLGFVMLWAYLAFSQYLIIYSGNLPMETIYYKYRIEGGWQWVAVVLMAFHFAVPFAALLPRGNKVHPATLAAIAIGIAAVHAVHVFWMVAPVFHKSGFHVHWLDVTLFLAFGGFWVAGVTWQLSRRLVPVLAHWPRPPWLEEAHE